MGILDIFRRPGPPTSDVRLHGTWILVQSDGDMDAGDGVQMEFHPNGALTYAVREGGKLQVMKMTYRVKGNQIISNQPSHPREDRTHYSFEDDLLVLSQEDSRSWFRKQEE